MAQVAGTDGRVARNHLRTFASCLFIDAIARFDVFGEAKFAESLVIVRAFVHRRFRPGSADERRLQHTANRFPGFGMFGEWGIGDALNVLEGGTT